MFNTFTRVSEPNARKRLQCNDCKRLTIHSLEARCQGKWSYSPAQGGQNGGTDFSLYRCGACDAVCFEKSTWDSENYEVDEDGDYVIATEETQYPPPSSASFTFNTDYTPVELDSNIDEMLYALAGGKLNLATVGLRLVIEFIVNDSKCTGKTLDKKINDLRTKELVDDAQLDLLHKIRKKGNAGAHQGVAMTKKEMIAGMGIIDLLIEKLYTGPGRHADAIKKAEQAFKD